jgi:hypothetical protein
MTIDNTSQYMLTYVRSVWWVFLFISFRFVVKLCYLAPILSPSISMMWWSCLNAYWLTKLGKIRAVHEGAVC